MSDSVVDKVFADGIVNAESAFKELAGLKEKAAKRLGMDKPSLFPEDFFNIVQDYNWGIGGIGDEVRNEIPLITMIEYQESKGPALANILYTLKLGADIVHSATSVNKKINVYNTMYNGTPTGTTYQFPFFSTYNHMTSNSWDKTSINNLQGRARTAIGKLAGSLDYGGVEERRIWKGSASANYQFSFVLYNTIGTHADILKNYKLIARLLAHNLPERTSFATIAPPVFYTIHIPGVRQSPAAVFESITVSNIGQVNQMMLADDLPMFNIPDAWEITISVKELVRESREIYGGIDSGSNVYVIGDMTHISTSKKVDEPDSTEATGK